MMTHRGLAVALTALAANAAAANLTILAVEPFGQPVGGCRVDSFRSEPDAKGARHQFRDRFENLVGRNIPRGEYNVIVACGQGEAYKKIRLERAEQFEVLTLNGRTLIGDGVKPELTISLVPPVAVNETWWIQMAGLYNGEVYTDRFDPAKSAAAIIDPAPGGYLVTVSSPKGDSCVREVDLVEFTRAWTFHPATCSFEFDRFAHLVQEDDRRNHKHGGWYDEMRENRDALGHEIENVISHLPQ